MFKLNELLKVVLIPVIGVILLEVIWNFLEFAIDPAILDIPLHLVKYSIYGLAGYIFAKTIKKDFVGGGIAGALTAGIGALVEGLIISQLFFGTFFYTYGYGFPFDVVIIETLSRAVVGAICGLIGSAASDVKSLEFIAHTLKLG